MNGERRRTALALVAIAVIVLLVIAVLGGDRSQPYGLESASPSGYRGLRLVLEHYGVEMKEIDATDVIATARPGDVVFVPGPAAPRRRPGARGRPWQRAVSGWFWQGLVLHPAFRQHATPVSVTP